MFSITADEIEAYFSPPLDIYVQTVYLIEP